ncbi:MAG: biopolymer transporter ExbD [Gammaproteobacteria bacterium]|nr:biopolymer transporter ExbD [Gammaproteobacteria bacterium]
MLLRLDPPCPRSRISLTALIDVVFILLLFFMLTTQFTRWRSLDVPSRWRPRNRSTSSRCASGWMPRAG